MRASVAGWRIVGTPPTASGSARPRLLVWRRASTRITRRPRHGTSACRSPGLAPTTRDAPRSRDRQALESRSSLTQRLDPPSIASLSTRSAQVTTRNRRMGQLTSNYRASRTMPTRRGRPFSTRRRYGPAPPRMATWCSTRLEARARASPRRPSAAAHRRGCPSHARCCCCPARA